MTQVTFLDYLKRQGLRERTIRLYDRIRRRWEADGFTDALAWIEDLNTDVLAARTVATYRAAVFHWLDSQGIVYDAHAIKRRVRGKSQQRHYRHGLTRAELDEYLEALKASGTPEPSWTILQLLPECGLRVSEMCALPIGAVQSVGAAKGLRFAGKGNKERFVPLGRRGVQLLSAWRRDRRKELTSSSSSWMFPSVQQPDNHVSPVTVRAHLRQVRSDAGLSAAITPHTLRHTYATLLLERGAELRVIQDLLGHASIATTARYAQPSVSKLVAAVELLENEDGENESED